MLQRGGVELRTPNHFADLRPIVDQKAISCDDIKGKEL